MLPLYKSLDLESLQDCVTRLLKKVAQDDSAILTLFCYIPDPNSLRRHPPIPGAPTR